MGRSPNIWGGAKYMGGGANIWGAEQAVKRAEQTECGRSNVNNY